MEWEHQATIHRLHHYSTTMILTVQQLSVKRGNQPVLQQLDFSLPKGSIVALTGPSGSGKTSLLEAIIGKLFHSGTITLQEGVKVALVSQQHQFRNLSHTDTFYYQQRFNSFDADDTLTVEAELPQLFATGADERGKKLRSLFALNALRYRRLLHLSNGENKRLQLAKVMMDAPGILLLDNPFTGLDTAARVVLEESLVQLANEGLTILFSCAASKVPAITQLVLALDGKGSGQLLASETYRATYRLQVPQLNEALLQQLLPGLAKTGFNTAVQMEDVNVRYGDKQVLQHINWEVKRGERWSLSGPNGAGKSTLLSLITADNPQAYANEIYLFDRRRGSGETIWEIKNNIGYVSPELHLNFDKTSTVFDTVASGLFDTIGLFRPITEAQRKKVKDWLQLLSLDAYANKLLWQMPLGTQRLVLLARALVKQPPLLVLDEPLQGLDEQQAAQFRAIIDAICSYTEQTMIFVSHYSEDLPDAVTFHLKLEDGKVILDV
jgi:molybdate transport system ATP-binding protein